MRANRLPARLADFVVAITGHRTLADVRGVASASVCARRAILERFPNRSIVVLSALAEGADRVALGPWLASPGTELVAMLPRPRAAYAAEFSSESSRSEFWRLLALAHRVLEPESNHAADDAYAELGRRLVEAADVLVAVWDGEPARGPGGTGTVVARARALGRPVVWIRVTPGMGSAAELVLERFPNLDAATIRTDP